MRVMTVPRHKLPLFVALCAITGVHAQEGGGLNGPFPTEQSYLEEVRARSTYLDDRQAVGLVRNIELRVSDQVGDACWTSADAVQSRIRVEFERSGIPVYREPLAFRDQFSPGLNIAVVGYRIKGGGPCVANARM